MSVLCSYCGKTYANKHSLRTHSNNFHKDAVDKETNIGSMMYDSTIVKQKGNGKQDNTSISDSSMYSNSSTEEEESYTNSIKAVPSFQVFDEQVKRLDGKLKNLSEASRQENSKIESLQSKIESLESLLRPRSEELKRLSIKISDLTKENTNVKEILDGLQVQQGLGFQKNIEKQLLDIKTQIDDIHQTRKVSKTEEATAFQDMLTDIKEVIKIISQVSENSETKLSDSKVGKVRELFKSLKIFNETNNHNLLEGDDLKVVKILAGGSKSTVSALISKFHCCIESLLNDLDRNLDSHSSSDRDQDLDDESDDFNLDEKMVSSNDKTNEDILYNSSKTESEVDIAGETSEETFSETETEKNEDSLDSVMTN